MGGPVEPYSARNGTSPTEGYRRLHDYRVEHILLDRTYFSGRSPSATGLPRWRQQVQYAVGHTLNDFYSLHPDVRRETPIQFLLERRWPPKGASFSSLMNYWDIKTRIADELMRIASINHLQDIPVKLYEQWFVLVPELKIELSIIFQLAWKSQLRGRSLHVQKFMVTADEEVISGFFHMVNVFCHYAYGEPPEQVEIYSLMDGRRHTFDGNSIELAKSLDYVRLLSVFLELDEVSNCALTCSGRKSEKNEDAYGRFGLM
ncbi:hypothetical protein [Paenibacillus wynnii]|uniref:hypothetical protein n=1 Tax=Paenibacillus wynnii TaxID=268407 RepID=UPI000AF53B0A|nr:hypothetical protein [Paenibacillus wynnii]